MKHTFHIVLLSLFFVLSCTAQTTTNDSTFKSVSTAEFKKIVDEKSALVIDVRTPQEFAEGHIAGAVNIDVNKETFVAEVKKLGSKKALALYCRSGRRSKLAASKLKDAGYRIFELKSGFNDWVQNGFLVTW